MNDKCSRNGEEGAVSYVNVLSLQLTHKGEVCYEKILAGTARVRNEIWAENLRSTKQYITTFCSPLRPVTHPFMDSRARTHAHIISLSLSHFAATNVCHSITYSNSQFRLAKTFIVVSLKVIAENFNDMKNYFCGNRVGRLVWSVCKFCISAIV
jgi:hypothetical protein